MPNGRDPEGWMRLQIAITREEHHKIKVDAAKAGMNIKEYVFDHLGIPYPYNKRRKHK